MRTPHKSFSLILLLAFVVTCGLNAQAQTSESVIERLEIPFTQAPVLELELTKYLTSDVRKPRTFELMATLVEPLKTENGLVVLPAQTRLRLKAAVRPGSYFGHPGEIVLWLDPFLVGKGVEGFACETPTEPSVAPSSSQSSGGSLFPPLCQNVWRMSFDHILDYAATPEGGRPVVLVRKPHHEGIVGNRHSGPPNFFYDPSGSNLDARIQSAVSRFQAAGVVYEIGAAVTGAVRFVFSRRDVFLPSGTRVVFQLEQKLRLVPAADGLDAPILKLRVDKATRARKVKEDLNASESRK